MKKLYRFTPACIVAIYVLFFVFLRTPEKSMDRIISGEGKGYYAYLPAIFIYHDLQFKFIEQNDYQYYTPDKNRTPDFRQKNGNKVVNRFSPILAIIWIPFFFFGHLMAWLEIFPMDGYSMPYQYAIALATLFFLYLGIKWLMKLLSLYGADEKNAVFLTFIITMGTNLLYFAIMEPSASYTYNFALGTGFLYFSHRFFHDRDKIWILKSLTAFTFLFLLRPANGILLMALPFIAGDPGIFKSRLSALSEYRITLVRVFVRIVILVSIPLIFWFLRTGTFNIFPFTSERFDFLDPQLYSVLFSFNRSWFLFTPVALFSLAGFTWLFRNEKFRFWSLFLFLVIYIYAVSSVRNWQYFTQFGQHLFIAIYAVTALLLLFLFRLPQKEHTRKILTSTMLFLILVNIFQFWQHTQAIYPRVNLTSEMYRDALFSLQKKAKVYLSQDVIADSKSLKNDMEQEYGALWMNPATRSRDNSKSGKWSSCADRKIPYSVGLEIKTDTLFTTGKRVVKISALVFSPVERPEAVLVVDYQSDGKSLSYNQFKIEEYVAPDQWTKVEAAYFVPDNLPEKSRIKVYFFNPSSTYKLFVDDLQTDFISLKEKPEYLKPEGILIPQQIK